MGQRFLAGHLAVAPAENAGGGAAGGGQRLEAEPGQDARGARVPGIGNQECPWTLVQRAEACGLVALTDRHGVPPCPDCRPADNAMKSIVSDVNRCAAALTPR